MWNGTLNNGDPRADDSQPFYCSMYRWKLYNFKRKTVSFGVKFVIFLKIGKNAKGLSTETVWVTYEPNENMISIRNR